MDSDELRDRLRLLARSYEDAADQLPCAEHAARCAQLETAQLIWKAIAALEEKAHAGLAKG